MKWFKFIIMIIAQLPISVFYYLDPTNPIPFLVFQVFNTFFIFMIDNAVSTNYLNIQALNTNFEAILKTILKVMPKKEIDENNDNGFAGDA